MVIGKGRRTRATRTNGPTTRAEYVLSFKGDRATLEDVFGGQPIGPAEMTTKLYEHSRHHVVRRIGGTGGRDASTGPRSGRRPPVAERADDDISDAEAARLVEEAAGRHRLTETEKIDLVVSRRGQGQFRDHITRLWSSRCAVTGCRETRVLRASHLKPWRTSNNDERLDPFNGLLLAPHLDALLDRGLITFTDNGRIQISSRLSAADRECLGIHRTMKLGRVDERHVPYLGIHRSTVFRT
jgi:HNH endonuclease